MQSKLQPLHRCLAEHGITLKNEQNVTGLAATADSTIRDRVTRTGLWGFFDTANAAHYGYKKPPGEEHGAPVKDSYDNLDPTNFLECLQKLPSSAPEGSDSPDYTSDKVLPEGGPPVPFDDSRYVAAVTDWSTCMKERGFAYRTPSAALHDPKWRLAETADPKQIATATADIECKISTNLVGIALAVQIENDRRYIDTHQEALTQFRNDLNKYLRETATIA